MPEHVGARRIRHEPHRRVAEQHLHPAGMVAAEGVELAKPADQAVALNTPAVEAEL